jgi:hypothetical protein
LIPTTVQLTEFRGFGTLEKRGVGRVLNDLLPTGWARPDAVHAPRHPLAARSWRSSAASSHRFRGVEDLYIARANDTPKNFKSLSINE